MALTGQHLQHLRTSGVTPPKSAITLMGELVVSTNKEQGPRLWTLVGDGNEYAEIKTTNATSAVTAVSAQTVPSNVITNAETKLSTNSTGIGNVITDITVDNHKITFTKGINVYTKDEVYTKNEVYTKEEVNSKVSSVYKVKGSKDTFADLPTTGQVTGDVWNVKQANGDTPAGTNYVWNGDEWDALGGTIDLSAYSKLSAVTTNGTGVVTSAELKDNGVTLQLNKTSAVKVNSAVTADSAVTANSAITLNGFNVTSGAAGGTAGSVVKIIDKNNNVIRYTLTDTINSATTAASADTLKGFKVQKETAWKTPTPGTSVIIENDGNVVRYQVSDSVNSAKTADSALIAAIAQTVNGDNVNGTTLKNGAAVEYSGTTLAPATSSITQTLNEMYKGVIENEKVVSEALNTLNDKIVVLSGGTISDIVTSGTTNAPVVSITKDDGVVTLVKNAEVLVNSASTANSADTLKGFKVQKETAWKTPVPGTSVIIENDGNVVRYQVSDSVNSAKTADSALIAATATTIGSGATVAWGNVSGITGTTANKLATGDHTHQVTVQLSGATDSGIEVVGTGSNTSASPNVIVSISKLIIDCGTF